MNKSEYEFLSTIELWELLEGDDAEAALGASEEVVRRIAERPGGREMLRRSLVPWVEENRDKWRKVHREVLERALAGNIEAIKIAFNAYFATYGESKLTAMFRDTVSAEEMRRIILKTMDLAEAGDKSALRQVRRLRRTFKRLEQ
ncbi:MAG: hypothetical protein ACYTED_19625 [Planctomycetota bacterium]